MPRASQQTTHYLKSQIRAKSSQVLSSLYDVHDQTALQRKLSLLSEAESIAQENVATSSGIARSEFKEKKRTEVSVDGMEVKNLPMKKSLTFKEHWLSHDREIT